MLKPVLTDLGKNEIARALADGYRLSFEKIGIGSGYVKASSQVEALANQEELITCESSHKVAKGRIHITSIATDLAGEVYQVHEYGFYSNTGVLIAYTSSEEPLAYRLKDQDLLLAFDLIIDEIPGGAFQYQGPGERLNLAMANEIAILSKSLAAAQNRMLEQELRILEIESKIHDLRT